MQGKFTCIAQSSDSVYKLNNSGIHFQTGPCTRTLSPHKNKRNRYTDTVELILLLSNMLVIFRYSKTSSKPFICRKKVKNINISNSKSCIYFLSSAILLQTSRILVNTFSNYFYKIFKSANLP